VVKVKAYESDAGSDSELELERGRRIIDMEPRATVATTKLQPGEPDEPKEGEHLFHSQMWVKCTPLHLIVDSNSQKNPISVDFIKRLALPTTSYHWMALPRKRSPRHPTMSTIVWHQGLQRRGIV
jgi:hypothetical protein